MSEGMERVRLHGTGPEFSRLVWGSMRSQEQFSSSAELADHLRFLLDHGVTTIDTAATYGHPHPYMVEEFLGKALADVGRDRFEVVTKCGIQRVAPSREMNRLRHYDSTAKEIRRSLERSLVKLGTDTVDLLLIHRPDYLMEPAETAGVLDALVAEGKTKHIGVSDFSPSRMDLLAAHMKAPIVTNQVQFSPLYLNPISNGVFDYAMKEGHKPMIWSPVGGGKLLTADDERSVAMRALLGEIAERHGLAGPAEAALAFVARHPSTPLPVVGSGRRERIEGALKAVATELDRQDWYEILTRTSPMLTL